MLFFPGCLRGLVGSELLTEPLVFAVGPQSPNHWAAKFPRIDSYGRTKEKASHIFSWGVERRGYRADVWFKEEESKFIPILK